MAASNSYGTRGWASSGAVTVDTTYGVLPASPASLAVPGASNTGSATLNWAATTLTTGYTLQQSGNGGASWTNAYQGTATSATVSGLADGPYSYRVQSCNTYGCSDWRAGSGTLVVTHPPTAAPALNATPDSTSGSYTVSWGAVANALTYLLQEQVNGGGWSTVRKRPPAAPSVGQINALHYAPGTTGAKRWARRSRVWTGGWPFRLGGC